MKHKAILIFVILVVMSNISYEAFSQTSKYDDYVSFFGDRPIEKWNFSIDVNTSNNQEIVNYKYNNILDGCVDSAKVALNIEFILSLTAKTAIQLNKITSVDTKVKHHLGNHLEYGFTENIESAFLVGSQWKLLK